jgi:hypothetical protein
MTRLRTEIGHQKIGSNRGWKGYNRFHPKENQQLVVVQPQFLRRLTI